MQRTLEQHEFLRQRLTALELRELGYTATSCSKSADDEPTVQGGATEQADGIRTFAFEDTLNTSRPYRNATGDSDDALSIVSSAGRTGSWSTVSGLSLSEISHIAILAIPIYPSDINNRDAYVFDMEVAMEGELSAATPPSSDGFSFPHVESLGQLTVRERLVIRLEEIFKVERPRGVFGVPLHQSIDYAYLQNWRPTVESGLELRSYMIPIVIGSAGKYIKERGELIFISYIHFGRSGLTDKFRFLCPRYIFAEWTSQAHVPTAHPLQLASNLRQETLMEGLYSLRRGGNHAPVPQEPP